MMTRLVPTARDMGSPPSNTSAGTIRKPPPTPTKPVTIPTPRPSSEIFQRAWDGRGASGGRTGRSIRTPAAPVRIANTASCSRPLANCARYAPAYVPPMLGRPNRSTLVQATWRRLTYGSAPKTLIVPTMPSEPAIAIFSGWPTR